jgi:hypothetical protein
MEFENLLNLSISFFIFSMHSFVPSKTQYRAAFGIAQKLRSIVITKAAEPYVEQAWEAARTTTKPLRDSKDSRAKIRYNKKIKRFIIYGSES